MPIVKRKKWNTHVKRFVRAAQLTVPGPLRSVLLLPGSYAWDAKYLQKIGAVNQESQGLCVDNDPVVCSNAVQSLEKLGLGHWDVKCGQLEETTIDRQLDFAYLDLCSAPSRAFCFWLHHELAPKLTDEGHISFTLLRNSRRSGAFMQQLASEQFFTGSGLLNSTITTWKRYLQPGAELTPTCVTMLALLQVCFDGYLLRPTVLWPYASGPHGAYLLGATFKIRRAGVRTAPPKLVEQLFS